MKLFKYGATYVVLLFIALKGYWIFIEKYNSMAFIFLLVPFILPFLIFFSKKTSGEKIKNLWVAFLSFFIAFPIGLMFSMIGQNIDGWIILGIIPYMLYLAFLLLVTYILNIILSLKKQLPKVISETPEN